MSAAFHVRAETPKQMTKCILGHLKCTNHLRPKVQSCTSQKVVFFKVVSLSWFVNWINNNYRLSGRSWANFSLLTWTGQQLSTSWPENNYMFLMPMIIPEFVISSFFIVTVWTPGGAAIIFAQSWNLKLKFFSGIPFMKKIGSKGSLVHFCPKMSQNGPKITIEILRVSYKKLENEQNSQVIRCSNTIKVSFYRFHEYASNF